jgi:hypothetical protein
MGRLTVDKKTLEKYFGLLDSLDNPSKKKLIIKLTKSLESKVKKVDLKTLFGAWYDLKDSDKIIKEITESRMERSAIESFEWNIC